MKTLDATPIDLVLSRSAEIRDFNRASDGSMTGQATWKDEVVHIRDLRGLEIYGTLQEGDQ
ncbi:hypothetical protein BKA56DRAFT_578423 [Ilyonectria sp. MPI-CAGE-AT-0026]|nr:hypothetical protein BKA56DRAFT_578423 [Ilyonectria sp. MPI-CAGE-AT-0026]